MKMKIGKVVTALAVGIVSSLAFADAGRPASWIYYPGELGIYLGETVQAGRPEWNGYTPVMWPQYHHWTRVTFTKSVELTEDEEVEVRACGTGCLGIPGARHPFHFDRPRVTLPKGRYTLKATIVNIEKLPALYVSGRTVKTDGSWKASWDDVTELPASADGDFTDAAVPPCDFRLKREPAKAVRTVRDGKTVLADFGRETFGFLTLHGVKGSGKVKIVWAESETEAMAEPMEMLPFGKDVVDSWEVIDVDATGDWTYGKSRGFRFVRVAPVAGDLSFESVSMEREFLPLETRGAFRCSDERLNRIWDTSVYTLGLTMREVMIEGLKRDRWCWSGDAYQSFLMNYYVFADAASVRRTLWAMRGKDPVRRHVNTILDYTFIWFMAVKDYYLYTGDAKFLQEIYPSMVTLMDFCLGRLDANGMAVGRPGDWVFVDWAPEPLDNESGAVAFEQIVFVRALESIGACAGICGRQDEAKAYLDRAKALKAKIVPAFWDEKKGALVHTLDASGSRKAAITRYPNMFALMYGYFDADRADKVVKNVLLNDDVMMIQTPYMRFYELEALCSVGRLDHVMSEMRSYWGDMLDLGATTFWELYNPNDKGAQHYSMYGRPFGKSLCHAWGASPLYLIGRYYLGVRPTSPGWATYEVKPDLGGLKWMEGKVPTPHGDIEVKVRDGKVEVKGVPNAKGTLIWNGKRTEI